MLTARMTAISKFLVVSSGYKKRALVSILTFDRQMLLLLDSAATVINTPAGIWTDTVSTTGAVLPSTGMELLEVLLYAWKRPSIVGTDVLIAGTLMVKLSHITVTS